jgi:hypothetical protein
MAASISLAEMSSMIPPPPNSDNISPLPSLGFGSSLLHPFLTIGSPIPTSMREPITMAIMLIKHVAYIASASRLVSRRKLKIGELIFQIYPSTGWPYALVVTVKMAAVATAAVAAAVVESGGMLAAAVTSIVVAAATVMRQRQGQWQWRRWQHQWRQQRQ